MEEIWKDVKGYEGFYQVSNLGNVRSLDRTIVDKRGHVYLIDGQIMTKINTTDGYWAVKLSKNCHRKSVAVHRLVAQAFIPNLDGLSEVNHIDLNRKNNRVDNLEWISHVENVRYSSNQGRYSKNKLGIANGRATKVALFDKDMIHIKDFDLINDCATYLIENHITSSQMDSVAGSIGQAMKNGCLYLKHYYKPIIEREVG